PHFNIGYQANGKTDLITAVNAANTAILKGSLPNRLIYSGGVDFALFKKLTVNLDGIAQHVFDAQRATLLPTGACLFGTGSSPNPCQGSGSGSNVYTTIPVLQPVTASYDRGDAAGGLKWNPYKGFLITGNVSVKLNQAGLRSRVVPLVGASLTF